MGLTKAVKERKSIRRFRADEVSQEVISEILEAARWAPSWGNTQPWEWYILTGRALEEVRRENREYYIAGIPSCPEIEMPELWTEVLKERYVNVGRSVLLSLGITRQDTEARNKYYADMFGFFGAPCLIVICVDRTICLEYAMFDAGLVSQTICLLAHEKALGTCMLAASVRYPKLVRKYAAIPDGKILVIGIAIGHPDWENPVNNFKRERGKFKEFASWAK